MDFCPPGTAIDGLKFIQSLLNQLQFNPSIDGFNQGSSNFLYKGSVYCPSDLKACKETQFGDHWFKS